MKYVILEKHGDMPRVRLGFAPETHKQLAQSLVADGFSAVSAGFVSFDDFGRATTFGQSDSLNLKPRAHDAAFITTFNRVTKDQAK